VPGESTPPTPDIQASQPGFSLKFPLGNDKTSLPLGKHVGQASGSGVTPPIRSIVEDLKDKVMCRLGQISTSEYSLRMTG